MINQGGSENDSRMDSLVFQNDFSEKLQLFVRFFCILMRILEIP